jgi:hypothetical protein
LICSETSSKRVLGPYDLLIPEIVSMNERRLCEVKAPEASLRCFNLMIHRDTADGWNTLILWQ